MKRAFSLILPALAVLICLPAEAETRFEQRARQKQEIAAKITWPNHEPLVFYLRRGRRAENWPEIYERQHAPENIQRMADAGVRYGRLHFYKGLGLDMEMPEIRKSAKMAEMMHKLGMKVSIYVAGTMFIEPFYREVPEAEQWAQRDQVGRPVPYSGTQTFRHFACPNEPAYREYMKKVLDVGIHEVKTDEFFFDNVFLQPEPKSCRCERCQKAFKEFLRRKYTSKEVVFRRFGYPDVDYIKVNEWYHYNRPEDLTEVDDPVLQEWVAFRAESLKNHCSALYDYIKSVNPKLGVGFNLKGIYGTNRIWRNAVYHPLYRGKIDFSPFDVGGMEARIDSRTGALVSEIRSYKMGRTLGYSYNEGGNPLEFSLYMAFNYQKFVPGYGYMGGPWARGAGRSFSPEAEFFREYNDRYFTDTENVADVAVLRTWPSMAYSIVATSVPTILMEQVLIQHKVPFDIIFDEEIDKIGRYKAIVVPGQECLSGEWIDQLTAYVRNGGTLVFTDNTAHYNEWRERRVSNPLLSLMEVSNPSGVTVKTVGKGKMVYIERIVPDSGPGERRRVVGIAGDETELEVSGPARGGTFSASQWVLPKNHKEIYQAVAGNLPEGLSITAEAPLTTVMELLNRKKTNETIVHFVNFDHSRRLSPFAVRLAKQMKGKVKSVSLFSPEFDQPQELKFTEEANRLSFNVPGMKRYSMIVVSHD